VQTKSSERDLWPESMRENMAATTSNCTYPSDMLFSPSIGYPWQGRAIPERLRFLQLLRLQFTEEPKEKAKTYLHQRLTLQILQDTRASPGTSCVIHRNSESVRVVHVKSSIVWRGSARAVWKISWSNGCRATDAVRVLGFSVVGMGTQSQGHVRV